MDRVIQWLMDGDAAVRWQVLRDLAGAAEGTVERERRKVALEGWGARLLAMQDPQGTWAGGQSSDGGLYLPKWISTTYTMLVLRDFGLLPSNRQARKACKLLLDGGLQRDGGINYGAWAKWTRRSETCVTGMVLSILSYFEYKDARLDTLAGHLLEQQMADGGWNCRLPKGATHASVHTTISVLEGLRHYELRRGHRVREVRTAQHRGREFLLVHHLFRSHRTGAVIRPEFTRFYFRRDGTTISSAHSITSRRSTRRSTRASRRRSALSVANSERTVAGHSNTRTKVRHISSLNASARRAAGILCALCGCLRGGIREV